MKAARLVALGEPLRIEEIPVPPLGPEDVLVRVAHCGLNGGDAHLVAGDFRVSPEYMPGVRLPITLGHDGGGVVAEIGPEVQHFKAGDRVYISTSINCRRCLYCQTDRGYICDQQELRGWITYNANPHFARYKDGLAAEYALAHFSHLVKLPSEVSFDVAGHLTILGVVHRAVRRARLSPGDVIVITGATGITGAAAVLFARLFSPRLIIAVARERPRLERLRSVDPHVIEVIPMAEEDLSQRLLDLTHGQGADVLLDFVPKGVETTCQAIYRMGKAGRVVLAGGCTEELRVSYRFLFRNYVEISTSKGYDPNDVMMMIDFVRSGKLDLSPIAIRNFPLDQANEALRVLTERPGDQPLWVEVVPDPSLA